MATMLSRFLPSVKHRITPLLVLEALTCAFGAARAEKADRSKPMNIEADALRHDEVKQTSVFSGRVVMTKGSIVLRGARLDVRQDADGYQSGIVTAEAGKRAFFRQKRDTLPGAPEEFIEGEGEVIEYDGRTDNVRFITRAELRRYRGGALSDQITGAVIVYNNLTDVFTVDGQKSHTFGRRPSRWRPRARGTGAQGARRRCCGACSPGLWPGTAPQQFFGWWQPVSDRSAQAAAPGASSSRLEVAHLAKSYGSRKVVKDVSLVVQKGEVVGLLGPNGAGKTTSFYMIVGLVRSDGGDIRIDGQSVAHMPIHRRSRLGLSYLPQEASIFRKLSVEENVRAVLELQRDENNAPLSRAAIEEQLTSLLQELRVDHLRASPALALSGGERRRVEIARALATQPRFILLDEPFAGIDPIAVIEIQRIIGFLKARGIGVLITDHNVRETLGICDHAFIISDGRVLAQGTPSEIVDNAEVRRVYLGEHFRM